MRRSTLLVLTILACAPLAHADFNAGTALVKRLPEVKFDQSSLSDAIDFFRTATDGNFVVDWKSLEQVGIGKEAVVTLQLRNIPTGVALKKTLDSAAPNLLTFYVDQNVVTITTQAVADERVVTRSYAVQDLISDVPDFVGPDFDLTQTRGGGSRTGGQSGGNSGSSGGSLFSNSSDTQKSDETLTRAQRAQKLIDLIQTTIRPEIWTVNGGKSTIKYYNGYLIVTAPISVQKRIG